MPKAPKEPKPAKEPKGKKAKDPNAPKKPLGAYMFFCQEMREQVKADNPGAGVAQIGAALGALWKETPDEDKKKFQDMAKADKVRYEKAIAEYNGDA